MKKPFNLTNRLALLVNSLGVSKLFPWATSVELQYNEVGFDNYTGTSGAPNTIFTATERYFDGTTRVCIEIHFPRNSVDTVPGTGSIVVYRGAIQVGTFKLSSGAGLLGMSTHIKFYDLPPAGLHVYTLKKYIDAGAASYSKFSGEYNNFWRVTAG